MRLAIVFAFLIAMLGIDLAATAQPNGPAMSPFRRFVIVGGTPSCATFDIVDQNYPLIAYRVIGAFSTTPELSFFGRRLGISLDALTFASLWYANSKWFRKTHGVLDGNGEATITIEAPNLQALIGISAWYVTLTWCPTRQNRLGVSNRVEFVMK